VGAGAAYLLTFAPAFFYASEPLTLARLLPFQATMYAQQTQVLPSHTYQSAWWTWALDLRPIWYFYEPSGGAQRGVLMLGNPAVLWGGLVAVAVCLWGWARHRDVRLGAIAALWVGAYGVWAIIPKSLGFFYYYYLPSIWLPIVIAAAFHRFGQGRLRGWDEAFLLFAGIVFAWFYPILSASALSGPQGFQRWMWFASWM
jgi:dolichyl-phosphate-mannose--protein O-mannosyl transferase